MRRFSQRAARCPANFFDESSVNGLTHASSRAARTLSIASAAGLVLASAGFGAVFAWGTGSQSSTALGLLSVLMAVALECAKPLAIAGAFEALRNWRFVQTALLAVLGLVAITYSLTAELSLIATARGDIVAQRSAAVDVASKVQSRYERAATELAAIPATRPVAEIQTGVEALLRTPGANGCERITGPVTRSVCPKVDVLRIEQARAQRRAELEKLMSDAERETAHGPVTKTADPGAAALAAYLGIFGIKAQPSLLTELLILVGVVALEVGSALSMVLVRASSGNGGSPQSGSAVPRPPTVEVPNELKPAETSVFQARNTAAVPRRSKRPADPSDGPPASGGKRLGTALLSHLKEQGGKVRSGQRSLARRLGTSTTEMHRAIHELASRGLVVVAADRFTGTTLELAA